MISNRESSAEPLCPEFLWGFYYVGTIDLVTGLMIEVRLWVLLHPLP